MANNTTWHGTDLSKSVSLFEYGLLVRYVPKEKSWECVYRSGTNAFSFAWMDDKTLEDILTVDWAKEHREPFLKFCDATWEEWKASSMSGRISDFITYFGAVQLFGMDYNRGHSILDMCKRFKIKYNEEFLTA